MSAIKVLLSDFQFLTRRGLIALIEQSTEFELIGVIEDISQFSKKSQLPGPEVLVMDLAGQNQEVLDQLNAYIEHQEANVLIITNDYDREYLQQLLAMGVKGIITKRCNEKEIVHAIESVAQANRFFCNTILDKLMITHQEADQSCEPTTLTKREFEVLELIAKGYRTSDMAELLFVSIHTINSHRKNILKKLNLKSPAQLILYAIETKLVKL